MKKIVDLNWILRKYLFKDNYRRNRFIWYTRNVKVYDEWEMWNSCTIILIKIRLKKYVNRSSVSITKPDLKRYNNCIHSSLTFLIFKQLFSNNIHFSKGMLKIHYIYEMLQFILQEFPGIIDKGLLQQCSLSVFI